MRLALNELGALFVYKGMMENAMSNFQECLEMATQLEEEELRMTGKLSIDRQTDRQTGTDWDRLRQTDWDRLRQTDRQTDRFDWDCFTSLGEY